MPKKQIVSPDPVRFGLGSFADILFARDPIVGEDPGSFALFHAGMTRSLAPTTPYECVIAENLISIEWELVQQRRLREAGLREIIHKAVAAALFERLDHEDSIALGAAFEKHVSEGGTEETYQDPFPFDTDAAMDKGDDLARRAVSRDPKVQQDAYDAITDLGINPIDLMGEAYRSSLSRVTLHDDRGQALERRRREVKQDYDLLQRSRPLEAEITEAEVIEVEALTETKAVQRATKATGATKT